MARAAFSSRQSRPSLSGLGPRFLPLGAFLSRLPGLLADPLPHLGRATVILGVLLLTGGCMGMGSGPSGPDPFDSSGPGIVFMEVRNTLEQEVIVRVRAGRFYQDLGAVPARSVTRVTFPWNEEGRLSVQIEPLMGGRFTFPPREVVAGDILELVIQQPLEQSRLQR